MLNFTQHMNRIKRLADMALKNADEQKFALVRDAIIRISIHDNEAMQQLDEMVLLKRQSSDPSRNQN